MWTPHPGAQTEFCARGEFEVLYGGSAGPGKTDCLVNIARRHAGKPGYRGLLLRRTFPQLQEILDRCWKYYPVLGGEWRATEKRWYFPAEAYGERPFVQIGHMQHEDDKYNYQGKEFHFVGLDELTQFSESQYLYMFSRVRGTDDQIPIAIRATTNPGGMGHVFVKSRFVDIATPGKTHIDPKTGLSRVFIRGLLSDNPSLDANDPGYRARLEALPEIERRRLLDGDWDVFDGQVFRDLSVSAHGCDPFEIPMDWPRYCVLDWGYSKPFSIGWYAVDYDNVLYRYREWYGCEDGQVDKGLQMNALEVAKGILAREAEPIKLRVADPSIWNKTAPNRRRETVGPSVHEDMCRAGVYFMKADNDRMQGKMQVHKRLQLVEDVDHDTGEIMNESAQVKIFNDHRHFWRTVPFLQSDPRNPEDVDTDMEDHIYDEFRYMCMARPVQPRKVVTIPTGSVAHERARLIKAKKYAARKGCSLTEAYRHIR